MLKLFWKIILIFCNKNISTSFNLLQKIMNNYVIYYEYYILQTSILICFLWFEYSHLDKKMRQNFMLLKR